MLRAPKAMQRPKIRHYERTNSKRQPHQRVSEPPPASDEKTLARMKSQRQQGTRPEFELQIRLSELGYRFHSNEPPIPELRSRADMVFPSAKVAIFVNGCFWHQCPKHQSLPKRHRQWWKEKLADNVRRDRRIDRILRKNGWSVVRVWEHEEPAKAASRIFRFVHSRPDKQAHQLARRF